MNFRTRKGRLGVALAAIPLTVSATAGVALADDVYNNLDSSIDAVAEVMPLNVGGSNGTTQLYVQPTKGDGKNGCNLTGSTSLTLAISSSNTRVATVSPSSVTFTSCGESQTLTVTPVGQGSATVSAAQTANDTGGTFNLAPVTFTVNVAAPANTAPGIAVSGVTPGASYDKGAVPTAMCDVTDAEDGPSSFPADLSAVTGEYAEDGIGQQTATCSYTDKGGLEASASAMYDIVDPSAPSISYELDPATPDGDGGWYRGDVTLTWTVTEDESPGSLQKTGCVDQNITADQAATTYTCSATSAGGAAAEQSVTIKRDATAPEVTSDGVVSGLAGANGWYTSDVTVGFTGQDALSGPAEATKEVTVTDEGVTNVQSPAFIDNAGNTTPAGAVTQEVKIDKAAPTLDVKGALSGSYYFGSVPVAPTCVAGDDVSGVDGACTVSGYGTAVGPHTMVVTAKDRAGNVATESFDYTVLAWTPTGFYKPVDMNGVLNTVKAGSTVPLKFEVFAGGELTSTSVVKSFTQRKVSCDGSPVEDAIELTTTGGTSLRYDSTAGQFVQNWQTPKAPGACYVATVTLQDDSTISASFKLK